MYSRTEKFFEKYRSYAEAFKSLEAYEQLTEEDKAFIHHPMLHLAEALFEDDEDDAVELAKYICVLAHIKKIDVDIKVK